MRSCKVCGILLPSGSKLDLPKNYRAGRICKICYKHTQREIKLKDYHDSDKSLRNKEPDKLECEECGKTFYSAYAMVCCSDDCLKIRKQRTNREYLKMKKKAIQGYLLSLYYLTMYEEENELKGDLITIKKTLMIETSTICMKNKINLEREFERSYEFFVKKYGTETYSISVLTMILQLLTRNPIRDRYKELTKLALKLNKENIGCTDEDYLNAKKCVIGFYTENLKERK